MSSYLFTSESVTEGHPDKVCDAISDAVLDAALAGDKSSRVACETIRPPRLNMIENPMKTTTSTEIVRGIRQERKRITKGAITKLRRTANAKGTKISRPK